MVVSINDDFKNQVMAEKLKWLSTGTRASRSKADVSIKVYARNNNNKSDRYGLIIRNGLSELFGQYIDLAPYKTRLYIKPSSHDAGGYKLVSSQKVTNPFAYVTKNSATEVIDEFLGDFDLKYDDFFDLYYIERGDK